MNAPLQPEGMIALVVLFAFGGFGLWKLLDWVRAAPLHPDPWDTATERAVEQADAQEVCHRCAMPLPAGNWFCEHCGRAVGPYNNLMPYVNAFSEGEVYRCGVSERVRRSPMLIVGYLLISLSYLIFAPVYWFLLFKNIFRHPREATALPNENAAG